MRWDGLINHPQTPSTAWDMANIVELTGSRRIVIECVRWGFYLTLVYHTLYPHGVRWKKRDFCPRKPNLLIVDLLICWFFEESIDRQIWNLSTCQQISNLSPRKPKLSVDLSIFFANLSTNLVGTKMLCFCGFCVPDQTCWLLMLICRFFLQESGTSLQKYSVEGGIYPMHQCPRPLPWLPSPLTLISQISAKFTFPH